jgi:hypothetical protein
MILLSLGCELGQGYEIAPPMPVEEFIVWIKEYKANTLWQNQNLFDANQREILFIKVQHRAWIENIKVILNKEKKGYCYGVHECTFGKWLKENGKEYLGNKYETIDLKHKNIHTFADNLLSLHYNGQNTEALAGLDKLYNLRDEILSNF